MWLCQGALPVLRNSKRQGVRHCDQCRTNEAQSFQSFLAPTRVGTIQKLASQSQARAIFSQSSFCSKLSLVLGHRLSA